MFVCCKILSPHEWDKKEIVWRDKPFYVDHYRAFFFVPIGLGKKIVKGLKQIEEAYLASEQMVLSRNCDAWGADLMIPIREDTSLFETDLLTGKYATRLFEGHYGELNSWIKETKKWCEEKGMKPQEFIFWYATCPKCAKKRNDLVQVVVFAKVG